MTSRGSPAGIRGIEQLFRKLEAYIKTIAGGAVNLDDENGLDFAVVLFCEAFFQAFFAMEFQQDVVTASDEEKRRAVRRRLKLRQKEPEVRRLIASFEELCDLWPDIQQSSYEEPSPGFTREFHEAYLEPLLTRIAAWASDRGYTEITKRAEHSLSRLEEVL
jgi:hypothetical protein